MSADVLAWRARVAQRRLALHPERDTLERAWSLATTELGDVEAFVALDQLLDLEAANPELAEVLKVAGALALLAKCAPVRAMGAAVVQQAIEAEKPPTITALEKCERIDGGARG